ncbi:MAG: hypothetical protein KDE28_05135, partial [Anaerolineales bacterium]|nr:hypothetical protein [Anaerolineales bacterium]
YLQKDIEVGSTAAEVVEFVVPDEANLIVSLVTEDGSVPGLEFEIKLFVDEREVSAARVRDRDEGTATLSLRSDVAYDVMVLYGNETLLEEDVVVRAEEETLQLSLPFNENMVEIFLRQNGDPLVGNATVTIRDEAGEIILEDAAVSDSLTILLQLEHQYTMYIEYGDAFTQVETITVNDTGLVQLVIEVDD